MYVVLIDIGIRFCRKKVLLLADTNLMVCWCRGLAFVLTKGEDVEGNEDFRIVEDLDEDRKP